MSFVQSYNEAKSRELVAKNQCRDLFKEALKESVKPVFEKFDKVTSISVWGYTPSFNDGDPCRFNMNTEDCEINEINLDDDESEDSEFSYEETSEIQKYVAEQLSAFDEDEWESGFNEYGFKVTFSVHDGEVHIEEEDYDCGY
jgi:hypothetical protein